MFSSFNKILNRRASGYDFWAEKNLQGPRSLAQLGEGGAGGRRGGGIPGECTSIKVWKTVSSFVKTVDSVLKKTWTVLYKM